MAAVAAVAAANVMQQGSTGFLAKQPLRFFSSSSARFLPVTNRRRSHNQGKIKMVNPGCRAALSCGKVPDMSKRVVLNLLLAGALSLPAAGLLGPYARFFVPPQSSFVSENAVVAKDEKGNDVAVTEWVEAHPAGSRALVQGLKGDPTFLTIRNDVALADFAINAVCTHMGCVVQWDAAENKFVCHCHGSQYDPEGTVIRGPAPLSLALAHADVVDGKVVLSTWTETDFRKGEAPWWT